MFYLIEQKAVTIALIVLFNIIAVIAAYRLFIKYFKSSDGMLQNNFSYQKLIKLLLKKSKRKKNEKYLHSTPVIQLLDTGHPIKYARHPIFSGAKTK